jgi:ribonuclease P protein component
VALESLKGRANFKRVLALGQRQRSDGLALYYGPSSGPECRCGIMVTGKTGRAVVRSKLRRWARELLRRWQPAIAPGHDLVVLANRPEAAESYQHFAIHLSCLLKRTNLAEGRLEY